MAGLQFNIQWIGLMDEVIICIRQKITPKKNPEWHKNN